MIDPGYACLNDGKEETVLACSGKQRNRREGGVP